MSRRDEAPGDEDGSAAADGAASLRIDVPGMDCPSCASKVENAVGGVEGVRTVDPSPTTGRVSVAYASPATAAAVVRAVQGAGYEVTGTHGDGADDEDGGDGHDHGAPGGESVWRSRRALLTWAGAVPLALGLAVTFLVPSADVTVATVLGRELLLADALFLFAVVVAGQAVLKSGYYSLRNLSFDIDFLMSVAIVGATVVGLYLEAATLAVLFSVAELLERYAMDRTRSSLRELMDLAPEEATVRREGEERTVPASEVDVGDTVLVRPGEKVPTDGTVLNGESAVNQAPVTGESVPVDKTPGDEVFAGTINEGGFLEVEATAGAGESTIARVVEMVEDAQRDRTDREQFVERFASYYTPLVVAAAVLTAAFPPLVLGGAFEPWFVRGLTLVVLACPCAFVISTPVSVVSGITSAAKRGVLVKGGTHLEAMGEVRAVAFDKTGTLTKGELTVTDVVPLNGHTEADVLRCAQGLERRSEHPIGEAIVDRADDAVAPSGERSVESFEAIAGKGVRADLDGRTHYAGKPSLFEELGFDLGHVHTATDGGVVTAKSRQLCERNDCLSLLEETVPRLQSEGKTVVLVGTEENIEGVVAVADEVRPDARRTVDRLRAAGVERLVMLTGDNERTAHAVADEVGVDECRAELLPEEKVEAVEDLVASYESVAMVGDGVNDAPALATATVGVAMGAAGTDTAIETADVALLGDDLGKLPYLYDLSRTAGSVIRQNVWSSLGAKVALALAVPFGYVPIWLAVLAGDAGMTLAVTGNALRLSRLSPEE